MKPPPSPLAAVTPEHLLENTEKRLLEALLKVLGAAVGGPPVTVYLRTFNMDRSAAAVRQALNELFFEHTTAASRVRADIHRRECSGGGYLEYEIVLYRAPLP